VAGRGNLKLVADLPVLVPLLPIDLRITFFRAAQEAFNNILKHAQAKRMEVKLEERQGVVRLQIVDDGQGFDPSSLSRPATPTWGVKIMRQRIESIHGNIRIESEPGKGTRVTFEARRSM
jgi:two-component system, NarL family, sensor histidine kinase DegS